MEQSEERNIIFKEKKSTRESTRRRIERRERMSGGYENIKNYS